MSSFSFCSSCARSRERRFNSDSIYSTELDFVLFRTLLRSFSLSEIQRWIVSLCDFFYVLFRSRSAISHLSAVPPIIADSLPHTTPCQCSLMHFAFSIRISSKRSNFSFCSEIFFVDQFQLIFCSRIQFSSFLSMKIFWSMRIIRIIARSSNFIRSHWLIKSLKIDSNVFSLWFINEKIQL
jgi:hypothetical protein